MKCTIKITTSEPSSGVFTVLGFTKLQMYWLETFAKYLDNAEICEGTVTVEGYDVYHGSMKYNEFRKYMIDLGYTDAIEQADHEISEGARR